MASGDLLGSAFALGSALFWAVAVILYKKSGDAFSPMALNIYKSLVAVVLVSATMVIFRIPFVPDLPLENWLLLSLSGFLGITLADLLFFMALNRLGAGLVAVVECLYLPGVLVFSFILLDESLSSAGIAGGILVLTAVLVGSRGMSGSSGHGKPLTRDDLTGIAAGLLAMIFMALGIVIIKQILSDCNVFWATLVRVGAAIISLGIIAVCHPGRRRFLRELRWSRAWITALPASVCGNYLALLMWVAGMKYTTASRAAILNQMSSIFIFILAALFLREKITPARTAAIALALAGAILAVFA